MKKTILITGSTDGIGKLAAIKLAKAGHTLWIHGRNQEKIDATVAEIKTNADSESVNGCIADLSDFEAIKSMALKFIEKGIKIDVLINNAGVFKSSVNETKDGLDIRFVVNYLAPVYLTKLLMPLLDHTGEGRIINLSSAAQSPVSLNALKGKEKLSEQVAYAQSKLALTMWSFVMSELLEEITVLAVNPGSLLDTKMVQEAYGKSWSSADKGANILYELSVNKKYKGLVKQYFDNDRGNTIGDFSKAHEDAYKGDLVNQLLTVTSELLPQ